MQCSHDGCTNAAEDSKDECFRHRVLSVGVTWKGGALVGKSGWNKTRTEHMLEHFGTADDRQLGKQGVERA